MLPLRLKYHNNTLLMVVLNGHIGARNGYGILCSVGDNNGKMKILQRKEMELVVEVKHKRGSQ